METGQMVMKKRPRKSRHSWHVLYYVLAAFNILTVTFSLYLNQKAHEAFSRAVDHGQRWHERFEGFNELFQQGGAIKIPVDQVFLDDDVAKARSQMLSAYEQFNDAFNLRLADLGTEAELLEVDKLMDSVGRSRVAIDKVKAHAEEFFDEYGKVDLSVSATAKANIDREMQTFYSAISAVNIRITTTQNRSLQVQLERMDRLQRSQFVIAGLVVIMLIAAVIYGRRITTRMDRDAEKLDNAHQQLVETARAAGMAEIATGVLHNVGNVLNSVNVSATVVTDGLKKSRVGSVERLSGLLEQNAGRLGEFFANDEKGKQVPGFVKTLGAHLTKEQEDMLREMESLAKSIQHIKSIISMQQSYAKVGGVSETCPILDILEDAIRLNAVSLQRHEIKLVRKFETETEITVERHKMLQILVNLMRNAKEALDKVDGRVRRMILRAWKNADETVEISVQDNGIGFSDETRRRLFQHGFTTRKEGHGFGLHSGALAAKEMGGSLTAESEGVGKGACFVLKLPLKPNTETEDE